MITLEQEMRLLQLRDERKTLRRGLAIYHPLTSVLTTLPTGQTVTQTGTGAVADIYRGVSCVKFPCGGAEYFSVPYVRDIIRVRIRAAFSVWLARDGATPHKGYEMVSYGSTFGAQRARAAIIKRNGNANGSDSYACIIRGSTSTTGISAVASDDYGWHNIAFNIEVGGASTSVMDADIYLDGTLIQSVSASFASLNYNAVQFGQKGSAVDGENVRLAALRVWDRQLTADEIATLANEFTQQTT